MTTKKILVAFDPQSPNKNSSDFLVMISEGDDAKLLGLKSKKISAFGMMVYTGKEIRAKELFAKLADSGRRIENAGGTLALLEAYVQMLQDFRIGNILTVQTNPAANFQLVKLADAPPSSGQGRKLP